MNAFLAVLSMQTLPVSDSTVSKLDLFPKCSFFLVYPDLKSLCASMKDCCASSYQVDLKKVIGNYGGLVNKKLDEEFKKLLDQRISQGKNYFSGSFLFLRSVSFYMVENQRNLCRFFYLDKAFPTISTGTRR